MDALGICVCGSEIRTLRFIGTYKDENCTDLETKLPQPPIAIDACFHFQLPGINKTFSIKVSCIQNYNLNSKKYNVGANFKLWNGLNCQDEDFAAEANVIPNVCVFGALESFVREKNIWVIDETCTDDPLVSR